MTSNEILRADVLDILFDNRNKQYGAYILRKEYNSRLGTALSISLGLILLLLFGFTFFKSNGSYKEKEKELMVLDRVVPPKVKKPDPVPPPARVQPPKAIAQKQLTRMVIVDNNKVPPNVATQDELKNAVIGTKNVDLPPGITTTPPLPSSTGSGTEVKAVEKKEPESEIIQREPEFPGGLQAWINFLNRNLRVPDELQAGEKKTVLIRFQVSPDGAVTGFEVMQSAGNLYDNEVIRVLKKMPRWKPAIQNNMAVSRTFTQPVTFMGVEE